HFRPHQVSTKAALSLSVDKDVIDFYPRMTARSQAGQVDVRAWDPKEKKAIIGTAQTGQESSMGTTTGPATANKVFGEVALLYADHPVFTQEEADQIALQQLESMALGFISGEGTCFGRADLK